MTPSITINGDSLLDAVTYFCAMKTTREPAGIDAIDLLCREAGEANPNLSLVQELIGKFSFTYATLVLALDLLNEHNSKSDLEKFLSEELKKFQ